MGEENPNKGNGSFLNPRRRANMASVFLQTQLEALKPGLSYNNAEPATTRALEGLGSVP